MFNAALLHLAAILTGGLWGLCFGATGFVLLPWVALAPFFLFVHSRAAWRLGFLHGLGAWLVAIPWIAPTVEIYGGLPKVLSWLALLLLASYLATYHLVFAVVARRLIRLPAPQALLTLPAVWVTLELVREVLISGFPWNLAAYSWVEVPGALELGSWIGPYGLGALIVFVNLAVYLAIAERRPRTLVVGLAAPLVVLTLAELWPTPRSDDEPAPLRVRIIQPNTPILTDSASPLVSSEYNKLFRLAYEACDRPGTLLFWPESAAWPYAFDRDRTFREAVVGIAERGCPVLLNSPRWQDDRVFNSAFLVVSDDEIQSYDKRHRVPFGEYVPFGDMLPFVESLARNAGDFSAGHEPSLFHWQRASIGLSICFEVTFASEVADFVQAGATVLATITNDAWYGDSFAPHQHLRAARFRAAENARPMLRAALTGISAVIASDGSIVDQLGVGEEGILTAEITPNSAGTLYTDAPWLASAAAFLVTLFAIFRIFRSGPTGPPSPPPTNGQNKP